MSRHKSFKPNRVLLHKFQNIFFLITLFGLFILSHHLCLHGRLHQGSLLIITTCGWRRGRCYRRRLRRRSISRVNSLLPDILERIPHGADQICSGNIISIMRNQPQQKYPILLQKLKDELVQNGLVLFRSQLPAQF